MSPRCPTLIVFLNASGFEKVLWIPGLVMGLHGVDFSQFSFEIPIFFLKPASNKLGSYHGFTFWRKNHMAVWKCDLRYSVGLKLLIKQTIVSIFVSPCNRSVVPRELWLFELYCNWTRKIWNVMLLIGWFLIWILRNQTLKVEVLLSLCAYICVCMCAEIKLLGTLSLKSFLTAAPV